VKLTVAPSLLISLVSELPERVASTEVVEEEIVLDVGKVEEDTAVDASPVSIE
jgi:hypothetical protein